MLLKKKTAIMDYWYLEEIEWPLLQMLTLKVFSIPASSAASERNFSTFGFVHSKLRYCLPPESVMKLVYIKTNNRQFEPDQAIPLQGCESDLDNDDARSSSSSLNCVFETGDVIGIAN